MPLKEIELLAVLTENPGQVLTKQELLDRVWSESFVEESNLSRHIYGLRKMFESHGESGLVIETVPRRGYRIASKIAGAARGEVRIERRVLTRTIVEEIDTKSERDGRENPQVASSRSVRSRSLYVAAGSFLLVLTLAGAAALQFKNSSVARIRSIAVLPFTNINGGDEERVRTLGLADSLITRLSRVDGIVVRPFSAVADISSADPAAVAERLQVDAFLEGTIYRGGNKVRVNTRLVRRSDRTAVWSGQIERSVTDEHSLHEEIAQQISEALSLNLRVSAHSATSSGDTKSDDAFQLYQKGRIHWNRRDEEGIKTAERYFRDAVDKDPGFALAYVGVADTLIFSPKAEEASSLLSKAIELDPELGEAYASRGFINMFHRWNWAEAEADLKRSVELSPGYLPAHQWLATLHMIRRRQSDAQAELAKALEIDPGSYNVLADLGQTLRYSGDLVSAEEYCRRALEIKPDFQFAHGNLSDIYLQSGRNEEAVEELMLSLVSLMKRPLQTDRERNSSERSVENLRTIYKTGGINGILRSFVGPSSERFLRANNNSIGAARAFVLLGEHDKAIACLKIALEERPFLMPFINPDPFFDPIRDDPSFKRIISEMGL